VLADFMGTDPVGWITAAEEFFEKNQIHPCDMLQWAFMSMEGEEAMMRFYSWTQENVDADWKSFSIALIRRFGCQMKKRVLENPETQANGWMETKIRVTPVLEVIETSVKGDDETIHNEPATEFKQSVGKMTNGLRTVNKELLSLEERSEVQTGKEQAFVFEPPPNNSSGCRRTPASTETTKHLFSCTELFKLRSARRKGKGACSQTTDGATSHRSVRGGHGNQAHRQCDEQKGWNRPNSGCSHTTHRTAGHGCLCCGDRSEFACIDNREASCGRSGHDPIATRTTRLYRTHNAKFYLQQRILIYTNLCHTSCTIMISYTCPH
jgi:hypothetical protein